MTPKHLAVAALAAAMLCAALAGCGQGTGGPDAGAAALAAVAQQIDGQLDAPARNLQQNLKAAARDGHIYAQELVVTGAGDPTPVDWWIYKAGFIRFAAIDSYKLGYFALTPKGEAFVKAPAPHWLASSFQGQPDVSCTGDKLSGACHVAGAATISLTKDGAQVLDQVSIPPQPVQADLRYGPAGWTVESLKPAGGAELSELARTAMFGDPAAVETARMRFAAEMNRLVR